MVVCFYLKVNSDTVSKLKAIPNNLGNIILFAVSDLVKFEPNFDVA
jgi:hypothetical protein